MDPRVNALPSWLRRALWASLGGALVSGALWLALHYLSGAAGEETMPGPWEARLMKVHGLTAWTLLFVFGALASVHVGRGWRLRTRISSGGLLVLTAASSVLVAFLMAYALPLEARALAGLLHAGLGVLLIGLLTWHRR